MNTFRKIAVIGKDIILNIFSSAPVVLITEKARWSIYEDCVNIQKHLEGKVRVRISTTSFGVRNKIVHFASVNAFITEKGFRKVSKTNKIILTWFHIVEGDSRLQYVPMLNDAVNVVHTSCTATKDALISYGLHEEKIIIIPIGVDTSIFHPAADGEKERSQKKYKIPQGKIVIGSFQKDGNGWGEGDIPKLIKGPDIFCDVMELLIKKYPIHVLLTGPSRGYVKNRLNSAGIPYAHFMLETSDEVAQYYRALDLYLISSRAEGGPKALLESSASGIPVVSTNVGMVSDIMRNGEDCYVSPVDDAQDLASKIEILLDSSERWSYIRNNAIRTGKMYDIRSTVNQYYEKIYKNFLK